MSDLPREVSRGTVTMMGCEIEVIQLDNGQRIISAGSFERFLAMLENGGLDLKDVTPASVDTLPKGQDAKQGLAGTEGSAVGEAETPKSSNPNPGQEGA
jgi:hypothetical protein